MTKDQAVAVLMFTPQNELARQMVDIRSDFYDDDGSHWLTASVPELVNWFLLHFRFDESELCWKAAVPFAHELGE